MSVLLLDPPEARGEDIAAKLLSEGDEVSVVVRTQAVGASLKRLGAYVAAGDPEDPDLVARAAQHARTIVVFDDAGGRILDAVAEAASLLPSAPRVVVVSPSITDETIGRLRRSPLDYIALRVPSPPRFRLRRKQSVSNELVAEAVNAADDLAGEPRLELDLETAAAWTELRLEAPDVFG